MKKLIFYIGVIGSGKDYQANKHVEHGYEKISFADKLREMLWDTLSYYPANNEEYEYFKKSTIWTPYDYISGRQVIQNFGQTMKVTFGDDVWTNLFIDQVLSSEKDVVCPDMRFLEEFDGVNESLSNYRDINYIFCNYVSGKYDPDNVHESEHMAQYFLSNGLNDMDEIPVEMFYNYRKEKKLLFRSPTV